MDFTNVHCPLTCITGKTKGEKKSGEHPEKKGSKNTYAHTTYNICSVEYKSCFKQASCEHNKHGMINS